MTVGRRHWYHGFRLWFQVLLFPAMLYVALADARLLTLGVMIFLLIPAPIANLVAAWFLGHKAREARRAGYVLPILEQDAQNARTLLFVAAAGSAAGWLVVLRTADLIGPVSRPVSLAIISYALIVAAIPAVDWVRKWRAHWLHSLRLRARDDPENKP